MAYDFPSGPTVGQTYSGWVWDGEKWMSIAAPAAPNQSGVIGVQVFTASGQYTPSPNMTTCVIECVGGGGGGGGGNGVAGSVFSSGGGGAGGYSRTTVAAATIGISKIVTIGAAGAGGTAGNNPGSNGSQTSVGTLCVANGGSGGGANSQFDRGGVGGVAGTGDIAVTGAPGGNGLYGGVTSVITCSGNGGSTIFGGGGLGVANTNAGLVGTGYGSGGSGGAANTTATNVGGAGAPGLVVITEYGMTALSPATAQQGNVRYDLPQGLTANQTAQARANIWVTKKNYILNGAMMVSQENGGAGSGASNYYPVDQFYLSTTSAGVYLANQAVLVTPAGSPNRLQVSVTTADAAVAASDIVWVTTKIEGFRVADLRYGTAAAKTTTLQFGVKAPAGTYSVTFINNALNRGYVTEYVIAAGEANTDVVKTIVFTGDTTGTWATDNNSGLELRWGLMVGTTYQQAPNVWGTANVIGSPNQFNFMASTSNVFQLFDVGLYEGNVVPPFQVPDYASELVACMRYFRRTIGAANGEPSCYGYTAAGSLVGGSISFPVPMRASPTITKTGTWAVGNCPQPTFSPADVGSYVAYATATILGVTTFQPNGSGIVYFNARL